MPVTRDRQPQEPRKCSGAMLAVLMIKISLKLKPLAFLLDGQQYEMLIHLRVLRTKVPNDCPV